MEKPTWTVVQFSADNTVEAVPSDWIEHDKCYWPLFKYEQVIAAIRKNVEQNTCWPSYSIITFRNSTYDDYNMARQKTKKAECTSDLNSEIEVTQRKRIKNRFLYSDTDDSDKENSVPTKRKQMKENEIVKRKTKIADKQYSSEDSSEECGSTLPKPPQMTDIESMNVKKKLHENKNGSKVIEITPSTSTHNLPNNNYNICDDAYMSNTSFLSIQDGSDNAKYFKEIIRQQSFFKTQLWQMADDLREVKNVIMTNNLMLNQDNDQQQNRRSIYSSFELPLRTVKDIEEAVEQFLEIEL